MTKEYYEAHKAEILKKAKEYRESHKKERSDYQKQYYESHKETLLEYQNDYRDSHRTEKNNKQKRYYQIHKNECKEWQKEYRNTKIGRAKMLVHRYSYKDKITNKGECTLTPEQLIGLWDNGCYWCGEKDFTKLGADRINNEQPHTLENCVCSCWNCNNERKNLPFNEFKNIKNIA